MEPSVTPLISCWRKYSMRPCRLVPIPPRVGCTRLAAGVGPPQRSKPGQQVQQDRRLKRVSPAPGSDDVVRAVTEGPVVCALAAAQIEGSGALRHKPMRLQGRRLVRAIAEGLPSRAPASAPEI